MGSREKWAEFYGSGRGTPYPDENLVRLVRGDYADIPRSGRVLDVGFGTGANLVMFSQSGYEGYGLEVSDESVAAAEELASRSDVELRLGLLEDTGLPYSDGFFDIVVSWNAVYYHGSRTAVSAAIEEFRRVLRPGGVLLLSVIHPNSFMAHRLSEDLGDGTRRIVEDSPHDNRLGMEIFYEPTSAGWRQLLGGFASVQEGFAEFDLFRPDRRDAWRLFLARKERGGGQAPA